MKPILAAECIEKKFGRRTVLRSAGLWATPGRITVVLGRNGCGKTTLIRIACGTLKPDYGVVIYDGVRFARARLWQLARGGLFFLPERGLLHKNVSCDDHLRAVGYHRSGSRVSDAVERLRIADILDRKPRSLSGGETRRVELALALASGARCLVADEPFYGIAPKDAALVSEVFRDMAESGAAIIVTGHEVQHLLGLADEVIWHTAGTTHVLGSPERAKEHHQFGAEYLTGKLPD